MQFQEVLIRCFILSVLVGSGRGWSRFSKIISVPVSTHSRICCNVQNQNSRHQPSLLRADRNDRFVEDAISPVQRANSRATYRMRSMLQTISATLLLRSRGASAIGTLAEFKDTPVVFQDISFNVPSTTQLSDLFLAAFPDTCRILRSTQVGRINTTVISFGADAYSSPQTFIPGVSTFYADGGHATLTLEAEELEDDTFAIFERGNGLQYIKIGTETFRLSKAIEQGASVKYAYGWVDLDTDASGGLPLEVVVGIARDPLMMAALRVSDLAASMTFFSSQLGMKQMPFPLARPTGSNFEAPPPSGAVYLSFAPDSMGLLLVPSSKKDPPVVVGNLIKAFTIIVDDKVSIDSLPRAAREFMEGGPANILSPDGYPIAFKKFSDFNRVATKKITL